MKMRMFIYFLDFIYFFVIKEVLINRMIVCGVKTQRFMNEKWKNNLFLQVLKDIGLELGNKKIIVVALLQISWIFFSNHN